MSYYIFESKTVLTKWASENNVPILHIEEYEEHEDNGTLPKEFVTGDFGYLTHHIKPFYSFEGNALLTEKDRQNITRIVGLLAIQGIGLDEPPKESPYLDFLRSGEASMRQNASKLHFMMEALYEHFSYWALCANAEKWSMKDKNTEDWRKDLNRKEVDRALKWMRDVYFKKDWRTTEGPLSVYIV